MSFLNKPKIFIAMPEGSRKATDIVENTLVNCIERRKNWELESYKKLGGVSLVSGARRILMQMFLESKATHLLFVDNDMLVITKDAIDQLVARNRQVIAPPFTSRFLPVRPTYRPLLDTDSEIKRLTSGECYKVDTTGMCFTLITRHVIETVNEFCKRETPESMPFQPMMYGGDYEGEDGSFCRRALARGFDIWIDPKILIGHCGDYPYNYLDYINYQTSKKEAEKKNV
jgi:hypothetical protein